MRKPSKYVYLYVIQGQFGFGWEDLTAADDVTEARDYLIDYRTKDPQHTYRKISRRELRTS